MILKKYLIVIEIPASIACTIILRVCNLFVTDISYCLFNDYDWCSLNIFSFTFEIN